MSEGLYLGGALDAEGEVTEPLHLRADRLTRHGVVIGMTGSGKTGLSIALIEELVLAGVPVIALDPKGDLGNLALVFPDLATADFHPWVDAGEAQRKGLTTEALAESTAGKWRGGLAGWGIAPERLAQLRDRTALTIYTPGSEAGVPVDVLAALARPEDAVMSDPDALRLLVAGTVAALLSLVDVQADPLTSPEHIVLARIIQEAWAAGETMDVETLILRVVDPPFQKLGVFPLDRFWKPARRTDLAMKLNAVMASPTFAPWMMGLPLDPARLLAIGDRVPVSVFHLSHLSDSQRQFFSGLLLQRLVAWSRSQPGTSSLRGLLFLDEAFGYLPPHPANPPTKQPLLTLMKQARAVGFGVVLATQNPVDLDYKALTNAGTWAIGRLSTKQDVERVAEGLRSATGTDLTKAIGALKPRQFVLRDISEDGPIRFGSRWAMSFLRGPISRGELDQLPNLVVPAGATATPAAARPATVSSGSAAVTSTVSPSGAARTAPAVPPSGSAHTASAPPPAAAPRPAPARAARPLPAGIEARWLEPRAAFSARMNDAFSRHEEARGEAAHLQYRPALYARVRLRFDEERAGYLHDEEQVRVYFPLGDRVPSEPLDVPLTDDDLLRQAPAQASHGELPAFLDESTEFTAARKALVDHIYRSEARGQWVCPPLKMHGRAGETRDGFQERCREAAEDSVEDALATLAERYEKKIDRLTDRARRKEAQVQGYEDKLRAEKTQEMVNGAEVLASFFFGRKRSLGSVASRRKTTTAAKNRLAAAADDLAQLTLDIEELQDELEEKQAGLVEDADERLDAIEEREVRLEKNDIDLLDFGVLWVPVTRGF